MSNILKIWGERRRILLDDKNEIDLLYLKKDCFCSTHAHKYKANTFYVISGSVKIDAEFGNIILTKNKSWTVNPPIKHRFVALEDSVIIEIASVKEGMIDEKDIQRESQGGKIINGKEYTENELREKGMLDL
ncbi:unnamed protein product [marine sediment metagenome]|uniref:Mannose-6-phosphate isomerase type II C-terminal domain-containing protein n=1 Tax=marine sediment metagenome TaxID=412755 RepID=X0XU00_9ZZZZ